MLVERSVCARARRGDGKFLRFGASRVELEVFVRDPLVGEWLKRYGAETVRCHKRILLSFFNWLRVVKGFELGPAEFLNEVTRHRKSDDVEERRWGLKLVLEFSRDNPDYADCGIGHRYHLFATVKTFCDYYEADLTSGRNVFGKHQARKYKVKQMDMETARKILGILPQRERTICLIQLQSGMSIGDVLNKFNFQLDNVEKAIRASAQRIKINFDERKGNNLNYFTFISVDAIQELKKWLARRRLMAEQLEDKVNSQAIFINMKGGAYDTDDCLRNFRAYLKKAKMYDGPWRLTSHMFRKLFKTESRPPERGIDQDCVEFMMGHLSGIASIGNVYDKTPELYGEVIEKEYAKLEPFVNVYSGHRTAEDLHLTESELQELKELLSQMKQGKVRITQ